MSSPTAKYPRCPICRYPILAGDARCDHCGRELPSGSESKPASDEPKVINEGLLFAAALGAGLLAGAVVIVAAGVASRGDFFAAVATYLSASINRNRSSGLMILFLVPLFWFVIARRLALPGGDEAFDGKQVNVGTFAVLTVTALMCALSLAIAPEATQTGWATGRNLDGIWMVMPALCQVVTVAAAVIAWTRLDNQYGTSTDYEY